MPSNLEFRLKYLDETMKIRFLWEVKSHIHIPDDVHKAVCVVYDYLVSGKPWCTPIGHLVPRDFATEFKGDASECAIGVVNEDLKLLLLLPYSEKLFSRIKEGKVHINSLELLALFLAYIMFMVKYEENTAHFPPVPQILLWGDSMSANKWFRTFSTNSSMATNAIQLFAEYMRLSDVSPVPQHIPGVLNVEADDISRVQELFCPKLKSIYHLPYHTLLQQVLQRHNKMRSYEIFLPSQELLLDLSYVVSSDASMGVPSRKKSLGHFLPVDSIFSGSAINTGSLNFCFL